MTTKTYLLELVSLRNKGAWELYFAEFPDDRVKDPILREALANLIFPFRKSEHCREALDRHKLSRHPETATQKYTWRLESLAMGYDYITLKFCDTDSTQDVCINFDRDNLADTIEECQLESPKKLRAFLKTPNNQVLVALNKFLNKTVKEHSQSYIEIKGNLVIVKDKEHKNSVHTNLVELLSSNGYPDKISASKMLENWDDYFVLEG